MKPYNADVIVFGHTHYPEMCKPKKGRLKLLVNTGSWIKQTNDEIDFDTFAYIDETSRLVFFDGVHPVKSRN